MHKEEKEQREGSSFRVWVRRGAGEREEIGQQMQRFYDRVRMRLSVEGKEEGRVQRKQGE